MKKVLIVGNSGSIGRRYHAILEWLGVSVVGFDELSLKGVLNEKVDGIVIASPTYTHGKYLQEFKDRGIPILCEKPMSGKVEELESLFFDASRENISMVDNWVHMIGNHNTDNCLVFSNFTAGKERTAYNLAQPIYLCRDGVLKVELDQPMCRIDDLWSGKSYTSHDVDFSYIRMLTMWLRDGKTHWNISDGVSMLAAMNEWEAKQ
jgi:hypothetical protein